MSTHSTRGTLGRAMPAAAVALAAVVLAACGSEVAGSASGDLPVLRIGTGSYAGAAAVARGVAGSGQDPYPLEGTLPSGPASATILRYADSPVPAADVAALATALGVLGTPVRHAHGWEVTSRAGTVRVRDGGTAWSFARGTSQCPAYAVDIDNPNGAASAVGCAVLEPSTASRGVTTPPTVTDAAALAAARPVLAAAGLAAAPARVLPGTGPRTVVVDPVVDGAPTSGVRTAVEVGSTGVLGAIGVLAVPAPGPAYPVITAAAALDLLRARPQPEIAIACARDAVCPGLGPHVVTGATLGRTMAYDGDSVVLVPAWLFTIRGSDDPVAVVAVERRYLADAAPDGGATASAVPGSSGVSSGSSGGPSGAPVPAPPAGPAAAPSASDLPASAPASGPPTPPVSPTTGSGPATTG
ncbi:MAG: hypothetical protein M0Z98_01910 [Actinomycetales bacterium]|nr:hypothetical protein [Actinomycetales bacterium]